MKNANQIRQLLQKTRKWIMEEGGVVCPHKFGMCKHDNENCPVFCIDQAIDLFPCETCNGTGIKYCTPKGGNTIVLKGFNLPCPDCQKKPCETCNGTKQVPTPRSVGFGHENEIMDTCPDCQSKPIF